LCLFIRYIVSCTQIFHDDVAGKEEREADKRVFFKTP
jgi:hypothetical protein